MSAVEIASYMTPDEAERISMHIALKLDAASDSWNGAIELIRDALARDAYRALGYASHGAYVADRFGGALAKLGVELRREVVRELTDAGLSTRAIGPVFDVSHKTIVKDLQVVPGVPPQTTVARTEATPRATYSDDANGRFIVDDSDDVDGFVEAVEHFEGIAVDEETGEVAEAEPPRTVTGMDGKQYTRPESKEQRRKSLVDDAYAVERALFKDLEKLRAIVADDRFNKNKAGIQDVMRPVADLAHEILADLFDNQSEED